MDPIMKVRASMRALLDEREAKRARGVELSKATEGDTARSLTDAEQAEVRGATDRIEAIDAELRELQAAESDLLAQAERDRAAAELRSRLAPVSGDAAPVQAARGHVVSEPSAYRKGGQESYLRDLYAVHRNRAGRDTLERMQRNDAEFRALTTVDGVAGELVPPVWFMNEFVEALRPDRVILNQIGTSPMPAGTDSWSLPKMSTGTTVAVQTTQNTTFSETDLATTSVTAVPITIGGLQTVSLQLLEQSPLNIDDIVFPDLRADYAKVADQTVITNTTTSVKGLLNQASPVAVTYTDASPTVGELYSKIADAIQQVHTGRYATPTAIYMHPRRWGWFLASLDTTGRPLVSPYSNPSAVAEVRAIASQGLVGDLQGLPVYVDANIPINLGGSTNEDRILVVRHTDLKVWEGTPRLEVFRETLAKQGSVVYRLYNYLAQMHGRWDKSVAVISGTGLATPTF